MICEKGVTVMTQLYELVGFVPNVEQEGLSGLLPSFSASADAQLIGWAASSPYFSSANLNAGTGNYTVPVSGVYSVEATVNYTTDLVIDGPIGSDINPAFVVRRTSPTLVDLLSGYLPLINVNISLLTLRAVLGGGTITLSGTVQLAEGDVIGLYYNADGMTIALTFSNVVWSVYRIS